MPRSVAAGGRGAGEVTESLYLIYKLWAKREREGERERGGNGMGFYKSQSPPLVTHLL